MRRPPPPLPEDLSWDDVTRTTQPLTPSTPSPDPTTRPIFAHKNDTTAPKSDSFAPKCDNLATSGGKQNQELSHQSAAKNIPRIASWHEHPPFPIIELTAQRLAGHTPNFDTKLFKNLAKGLVVPTAVTDLHGLTSPDAWRLMVDFLHECYENDHRCVLIIHGKGSGFGPNGDMGAIKFQISSWLAGHPRVLAFHTAVPAHGGTGAVYAYLARYRV